MLQLYSVGLPNTATGVLSLYVSAGNGWDSARCSDFDNSYGAECPVNRIASAIIYNSFTWLEAKSQVCLELCTWHAVVVYTLSRRRGCVYVYTS